MDSYTVRKAAGDVQEQRVAGAFARLGWTVGPWGQEMLPGPIRDALAVSDSRLRYLPDLMAARGGEIVTVDAKDRMRHTPGTRYSVKRDVVSAGLQFMAAFGLPVFYVLGEQLAVLTPQDVMTFGTLGPRSHSGAYYLVSTRYAREFTAVFGPDRAAVPAPALVG